MLNLRIRKVGCVAAGPPQGGCACHDWSRCSRKGTYRSDGTG
jgi:hypothetical protein